MSGNFIAMVYAVLKDKGIDTKGMSTDEAVEKYNELVGKSGRYDTEDGNKALKTANGLSANKNEDISALLGKEFSGYKGQEAINKLTQEKQGHIKGAFHREGLGDIDLLWGNDNIGLKHIIQQRTVQGIDVNKFLNTITETIENGEARMSERGNIEILKDNQVAVIQLEFKRNKLNFVVTAYKSRKASW